MKFNQALRLVNPKVPNLFKHIHTIQQAISSSGCKRNYANLVSFQRCQPHFEKDSYSLISQSSKSSRDHFLVISPGGKAVWNTCGRSQVLFLCRKEWSKSQSTHWLFILLRLLALFFRAIFSLLFLPQKSKFIK